MAKTFGIVSVVMTFLTIIHGRLKICAVIHHKPRKHKLVTKTEFVLNLMALDLDAFQDIFIDFLQ